VSRCSGLNAFLCLCRYYTESDLFDLIRLILERDAKSIHKVDRDEWSALHLLLRFNTENQHIVDIVRYLIGRGINAKLINTNNSTTICFSFRNSIKPNTLEIARLLINAGVDVNMKHKFGWNALQILCRHYSNENILQIVELMIESGGVDLHSTNIYGSNALMLLCRYYSGANLVDIVRLLIERGVDVCAINNNGWSALLFLSFYYTGSNLVDIIRLLIQKNKNVVRHRSNAGLTVPDALSRNWSGQLHSIVQNLTADGTLELDVCLTEVLAIGAARIGCVKTACRLMQRIGTHNVVDIFDRDVFTYLSYVIHLSFSLCSRCGPIVSKADRDMYDCYRRWYFRALFSLT
jgi:ankyrin repeat protein